MHERHVNSLFIRGYHWTASVTGRMPTLPRWTRTQRI